MLDAEENYNIYNKELLVIIKAFKKQKIYLKGPKYLVTVYIDYKNFI